MTAWDGDSWSTETTNNRLYCMCAWVSSKDVISNGALNPLNPRRMGGSLKVVAHMCTLTAGMRPLHALRGVNYGAS
jgi:hypothetical protein